MWNLGNEDFLPTLGGMRGAEYARRFAIFAKAMRAVDPSIQLVAVGAFDPPGRLPLSHPIYRLLRFNFDWNEEALPGIGGADLYSIHYYGPQDSIRNLSLSEIEKASLVSAEDLGGKLDRLQQQMDRYAPGHKRLPIALDEWAINLPKNQQGQLGPAFAMELKDPQQAGLQGSLLTLRDALAEAAVYNLMQRRPGDFGLSSRTLLFAYGIGLIATSRTQAIDSPAAELLRLYATRSKAESLHVKVESPRFTVAPAEGFKGALNAPALDVSARRARETVEVFVLNRDLISDLEADVALRGGNVSGPARISLLDAESIRATNLFSDPTHVAVTNSTAAISGGRLSHRFPAHSLTRMQFTIR
jgi:alpha-N-arabinofuranosidase